MLFTSLIQVAYLITFAAMHSLLASKQFKDFAWRVFGPGMDRWYMIFYSIFAIITFIPLAIMLLLFPGRRALCHPLALALAHGRSAATVCSMDCQGLYRFTTPIFYWPAAFKIERDKASRAARRLLLCSRSISYFGFVRNVDDSIHDHKAFSNISVGVRLPLFGVAALGNEAFGSVRKRVQ